MLWFRRGWAIARPGQRANSGGDDRPEGDRDSAVFVRSLLALWLVLGLLVFTLLAFWIRDDTLRSTLIGGLTASVGAAVAYYFSSKASDDARKDILAAIPGLQAGIEVPDLVGQPLDKALRTLAAHQDLRGRSHPGDAPATNTVTGQKPAAGTHVAIGTMVDLTAGPPPVTTLTPASGSTGSVELIWAPIEGAHHYVVSRSDNENGTFEPIGPDSSTTGTQITVSGLTPGSTYWFRVDSVDVTNNTTPGTPSSGVAGP